MLKINIGQWTRVNPIPDKEVTDGQKSNSFNYMEVVKVSSKWQEGFELRHVQHLAALL